MFVNLSVIQIQLNIPALAKKQHAIKHHLTATLGDVATMLETSFGVETCIKSVHLKFNFRYTTNCSS